MSAYPGASAVPPPPPHSNGGAATAVGGGPGVAPVPDSYFVESRKGEINELRGLLREFATERNPQRKRDIIKKVIAYMTLGIDVSRLFTEMMMAIETRDLVIKKMVYLYLTNYAVSHPELAQMCTNTLQKDCGNEDPMVRGLALRALCNLNLPQMLEYISEPVRRGLHDGHPYVRKTAVMGLLKLYHLDKAAFESDESGFVDNLYDMLRDTDASVVANCIIVLNEVMAQSKAGGMAINRALMLHLLNRIHEFNEFAKVQVLELVPRYIPANDDEGYQIMNLLDPVLQTSSPGAVMATIRAFWSLAETLPKESEDERLAFQRQIVDRVKAPLVTQISSVSSEMMYSLLKHVAALADAVPGVFDDEYRQFYVRYNEPTHVQYLKIRILAKLANPDTAPDIVAELAETVWDTNHRPTKLSRLAIRSMAQIACTGAGGPGAAESITRRLVELLDMPDVPHMSSEAATGLALMVRKHPSLKADVAAAPLVRSLRYMTEPLGKASLIYLLGECGELIQEAPYALERLIDQYDSDSTNSTAEDAHVKTALLVSCMKLFFVRPAEMQKMLGRLLKKATDDVSSQDLHDRALLYYRTLKSTTTAGTDPKMLETVIKTDTTIGEGIKFTEDDDEDLRAALMEEFNTLSILFGKTSENFIAPEYQVKYVKMPEEHPLAPGTDPGAPAMATSAPAAQPATGDLMGTPAAAPQPAAASQEVDLLGFGGPAPVAAAAPSAPASAGLVLNPSATMAGDEYQRHWEAIGDNEAIVMTVALTALPVSTEEVEAALAGVHVKTMASGELPNEFKFYLYAQEQTQEEQLLMSSGSSGGRLFLIQSNIEKTSEPLMIVTLKVAGGPGDQSAVDQLTEMLTRALN